MARNLVSWTQKWPAQDYTGFSPQQIKNAKHIYKKLAIFIIDAHIKKLRKRITYTLSWKNDKINSLYFLNAYTKPPAIEIPKKSANRKAKATNGDHGGTTSNVSPTIPPKP
jgi:hypothetical protein